MQFASEDSPSLDYIARYVITGPLLYWRPSGILVAFPVVAYGFTTHHFLFTIYASLKTPSARRVTLVAQKVAGLSVKTAACISLSSVPCCTLLSVVPALLSHSI